MNKRGEYTLYSIEMIGDYLSFDAFAINKKYITYIRTGYDLMGEPAIEIHLSTQENPILIRESLFVEDVNVYNILIRVLECLENNN